MSNSLELQGRRALITGGGHGLGRGIAFALARAGASIFVCGRKQAPLDETVALLRAEGATAFAGLCDVGDEGSVAAAVAAAEAQLGGIDLLVNNAGARRDGLARCVAGQPMPASVSAVGRRRPRRARPKSRARRPG